MKPLATLGDAMNADWRSTMRANDVQRRPPPTERVNRPDRGYIEQPEERVKVTTSTQPTARRIVSVIPLAALEREQLQDLSDELGEPLEDPTKPPERQLMLQLQPETQPSEPAKSEPEYVRLAREERELMAEEPEMPAKPRGADKKKRATPVYVDDSVKYEAMRLVMTGKRGDVPKVAKRFGVPQGTISSWLYTWRQKHGNELPPVVAPAASQTMASSGVQSMNGHAPVSAPVSVSNGQLPPPPTVVLAGLEEYIKALVAQQVASEFRRRLQGMAD